eukprot:1944414-Pyramimonas_sp.AAC.1
MCARVFPNGRWRSVVYPENQGAPSDGDRLRVAGLEVDTNTDIGGVPPPMEEDPDLGDGGDILASK